MWLRVKIFTGYLTLISLLVLLVHLFRQEQMKRSDIRSDEREQARIHQLTEQVYIGLLELSAYGETAIVWDSLDLQSYRSRRIETCDALRSLGTHGRQEQTDSLCLLLKKKESVLEAVMATFLRLQDVDDIVSEKFPAIVTNVRKSPEVNAPKMMDTENDKPRKENIFQKIFKRKEKKSAYLAQREKKEKEKGNKKETPATTVASLLYSLDKQVTDHQTHEREKLLDQMNELYVSSTDLNQKIHDIAKELERETAARLEERHLRSVSEGDRSFRMISYLSISISLLTLLLYGLVHRDLKRKYRYQRRLESSNTEKQELLQSRKDMMLSIAHDLRSPLTTINGSAELLPKENGEQGRMKYVDNIRHASEYMLSLVDTLMEFYLLDSGQLQHHPSIFHLSTLIEETADSHAPAAKKKHLGLSTGFSGLDVVVGGEKGFLQQVMNNLLSNAIKFTEKGSVRLEAEYRKGELRLLVQDTGIGMDVKDASRIFAPFERLENARHASGFGLGLAITSRLVSEMGGKIDVESTPGGGSCFTVLIPLPPADGNSLMENRRPSGSPRLENTRILLLDDDIRQLGITKEMLRRCHALCDCCTDSRELIVRLRENTYDVLLTDIQMPEMDGFSVLELLRSSNIPQARTIPVVALTAHVNKEEEYLARGFAGRIRKPFTIESLSEGVARIIGTSENRVWKPDFSLILSGEENRREMLDEFVRESRKDLRVLRQALENGDRRTVREVLHKNLPLWESVRLDYPLEEQRRITTSDPEGWTEKELEQIRDIAEAADRLAAFAEQIQDIE